MASRRTNYWPIVACLTGLFALLIALPAEKKQWAPSFFRNADFHLGLDLAGGTQLDFRISEEEMRQQIANLEQQIEEAKANDAGAEVINRLQLQLGGIQEQQRNIVEAIRTVLERRINALGVSEAVITPSYIGNEKHLLVECPGVVDTQECIDTVGKTIKLEFKEEHLDSTDEYEAEIREQVTAAKSRIAEEGNSLALVAEDLNDQLGVGYIEGGRYFEESIPDGLEDLQDKRGGDTIYQRDGTVTITQQDPDGQPIARTISGVFLAQVMRDATQTGRTVNDAPTAFGILADEDSGVRHNTNDNTELSGIDPAVAGKIRAMQPGELQSVVGEDGDARVLFVRGRQPGREEMAASHILVAYAGATSATEAVTRSKDEAYARILEIKERIDNGEDFAAVAEETSDGPSGADGGSLGTFGRQQMVPAFSAAAFALTADQVSEPVETAFGYHIIKADSDPVATSDIASYEEMVVSGDDAATKAQGLVARMQAGEVESIEQMVFIDSIFFSLLPSGWKDTPLDGKHFRNATVTLDPVTNIPVVQIMFDDEGAVMFQELTKNNVDKRIAIFVGGQLVSAPTVQQEITGGIAVITGAGNFEQARTLAQDLNTGAIPAPIFLSGQRTVEATLGATALETSLKAALLGIAILMAYMIVVYRLLGVLASLALSVYAVLFAALLKLPLFLFSSQHIVLSLAGMAGIILSIGMAVDANVLIFERMKEELKKGKALSTAAETGFKRAWPSIRDGNVSTFITCAILFTIGTSIVKGFAVTLGMGVLLSMFSAIVVTRWLIGRVAKSPLAERTELFTWSKVQ